MGLIEIILSYQVLNTLNTNIRRNGALTPNCIDLRKGCYTYQHIMKIKCKYNAYTEANNNH